jgi:hypothetical protein
MENCHSPHLGGISMKFKVATIAGLAILSLCVDSQFVVASDSAPPQASAVGYTVNTFHSTFANDVGKSSIGAKYNWFLDKWWTWAATRPESLTFTPGSGITITDGGDTSGYTIGTAASLKYPPRNWVGKAFGGGAYFEAELKFDPAAVKKEGLVGYPAWWLEPIEHLALPNTSQWQGQEAGYEHFTELDIFEYNQWKRHPDYVYSGAVHEWYGVYHKTCPPPNGFCRVSNTGNGTNYNNFLIETPPSTDFSQFHKLGLLWVPASNTAQGYLQYYFDGVPMSGDRITWDKFTNQSPPPGLTPWTFGVTDRMHFVLILGTGNGLPMTVRAVNVWQASTAQNLQN